MIVNSSFVPLTEGIYAEVLNKSEVRKRWLSVLEGLREFLQALKGDGRPLDPGVVADAIALYFKSAINRPPYGIWTYSPYLLLLHEILVKRGKPKKGMDLIIELLKAQQDGRIGDLVKVLAEKREDLDWCILHIPADTRPLFNSSSLVLHLLLTSAIAAIKARGREFLDLLRVASLLHDVGKPVDYRRHVAEGVRLARELLDGIMDPGDVDLVIDLIKEHHSREHGGPALRILKEADWAASGRDRLSYLAERIDLKSILRKHIPDFDYEGMMAGDWSPVEEADPELLRRASEEAINAVKRTLLEERPSSGLLAPPSEELHYYRIDIHGIQKYIREAHKLKSLQAGSFLVDLLVISIIPYLLKIDVGIHPENVLVSGGGFVEFIGPPGLDLDPLISFYRNEIIVEHDGRRLRIYGNLGCSWASVPLQPLVSETRSMVMAKIGLRKATIRPDAIDPIWPRDRCPDCGIRPATINVGVEMLCEFCAAKRIVGERYSFSEKWRNLAIPQLGGVRPADIFQVPIDRVLEDLMKIIAGGLPDTAGKLNYSVLKVDGNRVGAFMSSAVSISDLFQRSFRIDRALKVALEKTLNALKDCDLKDAVRLVIGTMYAGGDDALLVLPGRISVQVAESLTLNFRREMGGAVTLGAAIISVPEKHSIWGALDAASWLLEHGKNSEFDGKTGREAEAGFIALDYVDRGILDGVSESYREEITSIGIHRRRTVFKVEEIREMSRFVADFLNIPDGRIPHCGLRDHVKRVKILKSILLEILEITKNVDPGDLGRAAILAHRVIERSEKLKDDVRLKRLLVNRMVLPYLDDRIPDVLGTLYFLKVLGGGLL